VTLVMPLHVAAHDELAPDGAEVGVEASIIRLSSRSV
jgi:hypothetical protein